MDVPDVTVVVVYGVPKNMSQLYQVINFNYSCLGELAEEVTVQ